MGALQNRHLIGLEHTPSGDIQKLIEEALNEINF